MPDKGSALARRSHSAPRVVSPRNKVNIAFPLSVIRVEEPVKMKTGDWISLAGLVVSVIGFAVAIKELIQIAQTPHAVEKRAITPSEIEELADLSP